MTKIEKLMQAGGKRWQKNGKDRIYLRNIFQAEDGMSNKVSNAWYGAIDKTYYDVVADELVTPKTAWNYVNNRIAEQYDAIINA